MKLIMFAIHDSKAEAFLPPYFSPTEAMGVRSFAEASNDPTTQFNKHPEDFTLFQIGEYNSLTGMVTALPVLQTHGLAAIYKTPTLPTSLITSANCAENEESNNVTQ